MPRLARFTISTLACFARDAPTCLPPHGVGRKVAGSAVGETKQAKPGAGLGEVGLGLTCGC